MGATEEHAQAAIAGLGGLKAGGEANNALVEQAAKLRELGVEDEDELFALLVQSGATEEHAQAAIDSLDGLAAGGAANRKLVSLVVRLRRMGCSDEEIIAELVAKGETKAAVEGALRGLEGLAKGRIARGHASATSKGVTLVRMKVANTGAWADMRFEQENRKKETACRMF